jgi:hypothetical protein
MLRTVAPTLRGVALVVLAAAPLLLLGACAVEQGTTPSCVPNVDANGVKAGVENGCTGFPICEADPKDPAACCKTADGIAYKGGELERCLYAYGAGTAPTSSATTSGSSSSATTSGSSSSATSGSSSSATTSGSSSSATTSGSSSSSTGTGAGTGGTGGGP